MHIKRSGRVPELDALSRQQRRSRERSENKSRARIARLLIAAGSAAAAASAQAATITVNSTADTTVSGDGQCTLREALNNANTNSQTTGTDCTPGSGVDTITFSLPNPSTIVLSGTQLQISDSVNIQGPGRTALSISGNNLSRVFYLYNDGATIDATISSLTITQGKGSGGAVADGGENLTLSDVLATANTAGAAVRVDQGGTLTMQNSTITGTTGGRGISAFYFAGVSITDSSITNNNTGGPGGGLYGYSGYGPLTIDNTVITNNRGGDGGGGISLHFMDSVSITRSNISTNTAAENGGGMLLRSIYAPLEIANCTISGNGSVQHGGGIAFGRLYNDVTIRDTTISGNTAGPRGGGISLYYQQADTMLLIQRSTIANNMASGVLPVSVPGPIRITTNGVSPGTGRGGGISLYLYNTNGATVLENTTISGNAAAIGGGIDAGSYYGTHAASMDIHNTTISGNTASNRDGNANFYYLSAVTIRNSIIANGTAPINPDMETGASNVTMNFSLLENPQGATFTGSGNIIGQDPQLGPLADNGGPTPTHLPAPTSPVINAGDPAFVPPPATDQRGLPRVSGGRIDMGSVEVVFGAELSVSKTGPANAFVGQTITYNIVVSNAGPFAATSVVVTDVIPAGATFVAATPSQGTCSAPPTVTCSIGTIASGGNATIQLQVTPTSAGSLSNTASVANAAQTDTNSANNSSTAVVAIAASTNVPTLGMWGRIMLALSAAFLGLFMTKKQS